MNNTKILIKKYLKSCDKIIFLIIICSIIASLLSLLIPLLIGQSIDLLIGKNNVDFSLLVRNLLIIAGVLIVTFLIQWIQTSLCAYVTNTIVTNLRNDVFITIQKVNIKYLDSSIHGNLVNSVVNDIDLISSGLLLTLNSLFLGVFTILFTIIILAIIYYPIAIVVLVLTPLSLVVAGVITKRNYNYFKDQLSLRGKLSGYVEEMITNQKMINMFNYNDVNEKRFDDINQELHKSGVTSQFYGALINPTTRVVNAMIYAAVGIIGALGVISGKFSVGILSSVLTYVSSYTKPFNEISSVISELQTSYIACLRVFKLFEEDKEELIDKTISEDILGDVLIDHVSFGYDDNKMVLHDVCIHAKKGTTTAIVGKTGCGKTTLINLLMRFYEPNKGSIYIDGQDIKSVNIDSVRSKYGLIMQDSWLFKGTIKSNIAFSKTNASKEEIIEAAKKARAHKFIMSLKDGYDSVVEEGGRNLSVGQRQLICIARIMLADSSLLILDEATSSIDSRTEIQIQEAFKEMMENKTTFIVAHRLSTIKNADQIVVMDKGKVLEIGTHKELLNVKGYYYNLYFSNNN